MFFGHVFLICLKTAYGLIARESTTVSLGFFMEGVNGVPMLAGLVVASSRPLEILKCSSQAREDAGSPRKVQHRAGVLDRGLELLASLFFSSCFVGLWTGSRLFRARRLSV